MNKRVLAPIDSCMLCDHLYMSGNDINVRTCGMQEIEINDPEYIPNWCPLPDAEIHSRNELLRIINNQYNMMRNLSDELLKIVEKIS